MKKRALSHQINLKHQSMPREEWLPKLKTKKKFKQKNELTLMRRNLFQKRVKTVKPRENGMNTASCVKMEVT